MTWEAYHRRKEVLRALMAAADERLDGDDMYLEFPAAKDVFTSRTELLLDLQLTWYQTLSGRLDARLGEGADSPRDLVLDVWAEAAGSMPGTRAILDRYQDDPALAKALRKEADLLAISLGYHTHSPEGFAEVQRIRFAAQTLPFEVAAIPDAHDCLFTRIKGAFAA